MTPTQIRDQLNAAIYDLEDPGKRLAVIAALTSLRDEIGACSIYSYEESFNLEPLSTAGGHECAARVSAISPRSREILGLPQEPIVPPVWPASAVVRFMKERHNSIQWGSVVTKLVQKIGDRSYTVDLYEPSTQMHGNVTIQVDHDWLLKRQAAGEFLGDDPLERVLDVATLEQPKTRVWTAEDVINFCIKGGLTAPLLNELRRIACKFGPMRLLGVGVKKCHDFRPGGISAIQHEYAQTWLGIQPLSPDGDLEIIRVESRVDMSWPDARDIIVDDFKPELMEVGK